MDTGFLCDEAALLGDTMNETCVIALVFFCFYHYSFALVNLDEMTSHNLTNLRRRHVHLFPVLSPFSLDLQCEFF